MKLADIKKGDTLVSVDENGAGYFRVLKVNRITVDVRCENGNKVRAYPAVFDRKINYAVPTLDRYEQPAQRFDHKFERGDYGVCKRCGGNRHE